ncbi:MAG: TlpA disulfide reductase family protein [Bacteroidota bacterium]
MKTFIILLLSSIFCIKGNARAQQADMLGSQIIAMTKEKDPQKNVASMQKIIKKFRLDSIKDGENIDVMKGTIAISFLKENAFQGFETYIGLIKNKFNQTSYLNMAAGILFRNKMHLDYAERIARETIERYNSYKDDPAAKPVNFPVDDWNRFMKMAAYPYYNTYAGILHANSKDKMALLYQEQALKDQNLENMEDSSIELYAILLEQNGQAQKAYQLLLKMAETGKSNINMNKQLKELYLKNGGNEAGASVFLDSIQRNIDKAYLKATAKKMQHNLEAPLFNLLDLGGKEVSLTSLKGKIVVLDFWATWCAPCIASMPAMEKLIERHPEVAFLFIATQENGTDATTRVRSYITKHKFPFRVLMDIPANNDQKTFQVATAYKLTGIPAKVVIDKQGKQRFLTTGYSSDAELINEMEAMIAIAKAQ